MHGEFLRAIRTSRGLSQSQLAAVVGIEQPNLSAYEQDRRTPTLETVNRIVAACGYRLSADAGGARIRCPLPDDGLRPSLERLVDDPIDQPPAVPVHASAEVRGRALEDLLRLAEAIRGRR